MYTVQYEYTQRSTHIHEDVPTSTRSTTYAERDQGLLPTPELEKQRKVCNQRTHITGTCHYCSANELWKEI